MNEIQRKVDELINKQGGYWEPFKMLAALVEEVGELADAMLAFEGIKGNAGIEKIEEELGDTLYALLCIANHYGINALRAVEKTLLKYSLRDT